MRTVPSHGVALNESVSDYRAACRARRVDAKTLRWYEQKLLVVCDLLAARGVTTTDELRLAHIDRVVEQLDDGSRSSQTIKGYVQCIKSWMLYLEREDLIDLKTRERLKLPRVSKRLIKTLTPETRAALFDAVRFEMGTWLRLRDTAILYVLLDTGIRASELCGLNRANVFLDDRESPYVRVIGKGDKEREVGPLSGEGVRACRRYLRAVGLDHTPFFLSRYHQRLTVSGLDQLLYRLRDSAGLHGEVEVRAHVFRHTYALDRIREGMDVHRLSKLLGHSSLLVTEGYLRDFDQRSARLGHVTNTSHI